VSEKSASSVRQADRSSGAPAYFLPRRRAGWWALGLLLVTALFPTYWGPLEDAIPGNASFVLIPVFGLTSIALAGIALFQKKDRSILLSMVLAVTVFEALLGILFLLALLLSGETYTGGL
jgi:hypothetical protein